MSRSSVTYQHELDVGGVPTAVDAVVSPQHARELPWRGIHDPYATWLSGDHAAADAGGNGAGAILWSFCSSFPTLQALADAKEDDVLTLWSGLGYYRRARMLHKAAQFVVRELGGRAAVDIGWTLRTLPGVGEYTAAAIASIAFGEGIAVVDGNVERVLLRIDGEPGRQDQLRARRGWAKVAQALVPPAGEGRGRSEGQKG